MTMIYYNQLNFNTIGDSLECGQLLLIYGSYETVNKDVTTNLKL
jgi:hypothetical protein